MKVHKTQTLMYAVCYAHIGGVFNTHLMDNEYRGMLFITNNKKTLIELAQFDERYTRVGGYSDTMWQYLFKVLVNIENAQGKLYIKYDSNVVAGIEPAFYDFSEKKSMPDIMDQINRLGL